MVNLYLALDFEYFKDGSDALGSNLPTCRVFQESENLEKENAALRKEVKQLTEEANYLSSILSSHEPLCTGLAPQTPDLLYSPHQSSFHRQHIAVPHYQR